MPFQYASPQSGALRQGEIIADFWDHIINYPPIESQPDQELALNSIRHDYVIVMSADCDLEWDFNNRFVDQDAKAQLLPSENPKFTALISHVFLAIAHPTEKIRPLVQGSDLWKRIEQNQDERYHHFESSPIGEGGENIMPDLYIDFKKALSVHTKNMYDGFRTGNLRRLALIPDRYIHDLMHRYYGFLSRVGLP